MSYCVVIPSIRELPIDYVQPLLDAEVEIVVVDDSNGKAPRHRHKQILYVDHDFQDDYLPGAKDIIPRRNPSCKAFGLYYAWKEGFEVVILLDDDCDTTITLEFLDQVPVGKEVRAHTFMSPSGWLNTMLLLDETGHHTYGVWPRGYPYEHRSEICFIRGTTLAVTPTFNEGLWTGAADINGIDKLAGAKATKDRVLRIGTGPGRYVAVTRGQKIPLSIMNCQIHRDLIPAFYQPPDWSLPGRFRVRRHDDVWSMYVLKSLMDKVYDVATVGAPIIWHHKEGDMMQEILSEHPTHLIQSWLTQVVDLAAVNVRAGSYADMAVDLGVQMLKVSGIVPGQDFRYIIQDYAHRIVRWAELFR